MPLVLHIGVATATIALVAIDLLPAIFTGDVNRYRAIASGPIFWHSQPVEFPPGSAAMVWFVGRWGEGSLTALFLTNLLLDIGTVAVLGWGWGRRVADRYLVLTAPLLPLTLFRLDHLSVLVAAVALAALRSGRPTRAGVLLGAGVLTKLWPGALLAATPRKMGRVWTAGVASVGLGLTGWVAGFGPAAPTQVLMYRGAAGWHVESIPGSLLRTFSSEAAILEGGAWRVGAVPQWMTAALLGIGLLLLLRAWQLSDLQQRHVAMIAGVLVLSPLFSLQYVLWLVVPVAVLDPGPLERRATKLTMMGILLTMALAVDYLGLLVGTLSAVLLLNTRNAVILGLLAVTLLPPRQQVSAGHADTLHQG